MPIFRLVLITVSSLFQHTLLCVLFFIAFLRKYSLSIASVCHRFFFLGSVLPLISLLFSVDMAVCICQHFLSSLSFLRKPNKATQKKYFHLATTRKDPATTRKDLHKMVRFWKEFDWITLSVFFIQETLIQFWLFKDNNDHFSLISTYQ